MDKHIESFEFYGKTYKLGKLSTFSRVKAFRMYALPILAAHFRPFESLIGVIAKDTAIEDMDITGAIIMAELDIDNWLLPAISWIVRYYNSENGDGPASDAVIEQFASNYKLVVQIVMAQIHLEGFMESYMEKNSDFFDKLKLAGFDVNSLTGKRLVEA